MTATPDDPMIRLYVRNKRKWSAHHAEVAIGILNRWTRFLDERGVGLLTATNIDCVDYLDLRADTVCSATAHKDYQHLCWLYEWLTARRELPLIKVRGQLVEPPPRGPMDGVAAPEVSNPDPARIDAIPDKNYRRLMASFDRRRTTDCRDGAICSLMRYCGPRMSEVAAARLDKYDEDRGLLEVLGKGNPRKWRTLPLCDETREWFDLFLHRRRDDPSPALFPSSHDTDVERDGFIRADAIDAMLERRCTKLGFHATAHQFRRACIIELKRRGVSETEIARLVGWSVESARRMFPRYTSSDADNLMIEAIRAADPTRKPSRRSGGRRLRAV